MILYRLSRLRLFLRRVMVRDTIGDKPPANFTRARHRDERSASDVIEYCISVKVGNHNLFYYVLSCNITI